MEIALYISFAALLVSAVALGWNIYRDVVLKPRLKVHIQISNIYHGGKQHGPYIDISATNFGPGPIVCTSINIAKKSITRFLGIKRNKYAFVMSPYDNPYSTQMPKKIEVGEKITLLLPMAEGALLSVNPTHVGISDSFGRIHWSSKKSLKKTKKEYYEQSPTKRPWGYQPNGVEDEDVR
jgi:hypothetical protein